MNQLEKCVGALMVSAKANVPTQLTAEDAGVLLGKIGYDAKKIKYLQSILSEIEKLVVDYGWLDGAHHKQWVLDKIPEIHDTRRV